MSQNVTILSGVLSSGEDVSGYTFPITAPVKPCRYAIGSEIYRAYMKVDTSGSMLGNQRVNARVFLKTPNDVQFSDGALVPNAPGMAQKISVPARTDEEIMAEIRDKFHTLKILSEAACEGKIRSMIVSGSPGTGKTYEVMSAIEREQSQNPMFFSSTIKGTISPVALYIELYRARDGILVLDDSDSAFQDSEALQLLKAATESSKVRHISYRKLSMALEAEGIPTSFDFKGCVIILTNTDLEDAGKSKAPHYDALISRAHYINAVLHTNREKILRIKSVIIDSDILDNILPNEEQHAEIVEFIDKFADKFRELSIRTVVKLAELRAAFDENWKIIAKTTLLRS